ncbi:MAG TPA: CHASE2 domain-containing protein [Candidatus Marinimicrobia bacterium]|nr:CHASE2 domain-containing protein [Candidatus Neomarinimicrobiota bacterium]
MKKNLKNLHKTQMISFLVALAVLLLLLLLYITPLYRGLHNSLSDTQWRLFHQPELADSNVVILAVDDKSMELFNSRFRVSFPWPRQFYSIVVDYLARAGARSIVFDIMFATDEIVRQDLGYSTDGDFARSMQGAGNVSLATGVSDKPGDLAPWVYRYNIFRNLLPLGFTQPFGSLFEAPIPLFAQSAAGIGVINFTTDEDGLCRRLPLAFASDSLILPGLALSAFLLGENQSISAFDEKKQKIHFSHGQKSLTLDRDGTFPIYWYGPGGPGGVFRYDSYYAVFQSAVQVMQGQAPAIPFSRYKDKHVIVCVTAVGEFDMKPTPFTAISPYPGGEIHATLLSNLTQGHRFGKVPVLWVVILSFFVMFLLSWLFLSKSLFQGVLAALLILLGAILANIYLFYYQHLGLDILFFAGGVLLASTSASMYRVLFEGQAKRQIRNIFTRYLDDDVIKLLMEDPDRIDLEGSELVGTVFFTDLQNFTTYSEDKSPKEVIRVLNRYFSIITGAVLKHSGLLDKYTGDGIMAIFGAPLPRVDHAKSACEVVLEFRKHNINELIPTERGEIATRIGISSGPFVVGNLGSATRMDYTAIGDTVNLAARLEGINKSYGTTNILSEFAWEFVKNDYYFRELDLIRVKGRSHPIRVFTLVDRYENMRKDMLHVENLFRKAIEIYRQRDWAGAIRAFQEVLEYYPDDKPSQSFIERCELLKEHPLLVDDDGVFTFKTK